MTKARMTVALAVISAAFTGIATGNLYAAGAVLFGLWTIAGIAELT